MGAAGFVHYFKGPTQPDGGCLSFCLWDSRAEARAAAGRPAHTQAAALTHEAYAEYALEFHRVARLARRRLHLRGRTTSATPWQIVEPTHRRECSSRGWHRPDQPRPRSRTWRAIDRTRARGGGRRRPRRPTRHRVPAVDRRRGLGRPPARDRRRGDRRTAPQGADTGPRVQLAARPAPRDRPARRAAEPGRDRPDRAAGDGTDRGHDGGVVRDRPARGAPRPGR